MIFNHVNVSKSEHYLKEVREPHLGMCTKEKKWLGKLLEGGYL